MSYTNTTTPESKVKVDLYLGDCLHTLRKLPDNSVDSIVTDPPYGMSFMGKRWDYDVPSAEIWAEALRVLKPGGHLLAFAGTRTQHRMAVRIEDAGFEIRDMIAWVYGSGFPKSLDVSKAIDKENGKHDRDLAPFGEYVKQMRESKGWKLRRLDEEMGTNTAASWWEGRKSGVQPPGLEQYRKLKAILGMDSRFDDLIEWLEAEREIIGTKQAVPGVAFSSDGPTELNITAPATDAAKQWQGWGTAMKPALEPITVARKPLAKGHTVAANVLAHGTGGLNIDGCRVGDEPITQHGRAASENRAMSGANYAEEAGRAWTGRWPANLAHDGSEAATAGLGHAARYFYCSKASKKDRNEGCDALPIKRGGSETFDKSNRDGVGAERMPLNANTHPTVKPTELMRWLVRLVTPPGGVVLDPFTGSGSTGKAAILEGFNFIGCELAPDYMRIAVARIGHVMTSGKPRVVLSVGDASK